jgi:hypothetical protein
MPFQSAISCSKAACDRVRCIWKYATKGLVITLTLADSKQLLKLTQKKLLQQQIERYLVG